MPTIAYDKLSSATPTEAGLATASGLTGYRPLSREVAPVAFNPFTYGQATGTQPTEYAFFKQGPEQEMVFPGAEDSAFSFEMKTNKGNPAGTFTVAKDQGVRIVDRKTGKVLYEGVGPLAGLQAAKYGEQLSKQQGKKANWRIETQSGNMWTQGAQDKKSKGSILGKIAGIALPIAASFIPGVGPVLGAAIGSGLGAAVQGKGIGGILKSAALGAGTSALGGAIGGSSALLGKTAGTAIGKGIGYGLANTASGLVQGQSIEDALAGGAVSGLGAYGAARLTQPSVGIPTGNTLNQLPYTGQNIPIGGSLPSGVFAGNLIPSVGGIATPNVNLSSGASGLFGTGVSAGNALRGIGLASALGGALMGSSGGGSAAGATPETGYTIDGGGVGQINAAPAYTGPTNIYAAQGYADGGEAENDNESNEEPEDENVKHLLEYHRGNGHEGPGPVKGVGSGQEDKIPAWLSDGEYVWSAQDVADLGDGSTNEGVRRLDRMRQMVRKQAGRKDVKKIAKPQKGIDHMLKAVGGKV